MVRDFWRGGVYGNALQAAASNNGDEAVIRLLLDWGADVNAKGGVHSYSLLAAVWFGQEAAVRLLLDRVSAEGINGNALAVASKNGHEAVVRLLLDRGVGVNAQGEGDHHNAMQAASHIVIPLLLHSGVDVNGCGNALEAACINGHEAAVRLLLDRGADIKLNGLYGSPLEAATRYGQEGVLRLLREHMKVR